MWRCHMAHMSYVCIYTHCYIVVVSHRINYMSAGILLFQKDHLRILLMFHFFKLSLLAVCRRSAVKKGALFGTRTLKRALDLGWVEMKIPSKQGKKAILTVQPKQKHAGTARSYPPEKNEFWATDARIHSLRHECQLSCPQPKSSKTGSLKQNRQCDRNPTSGSLQLTAFKDIRHPKETAPKLRIKPGRADQRLGAIDFERWHVVLSGVPPLTVSTPRMLDIKMRLSSMLEGTKQKRHVSSLRVYKISKGSSMQITENHVNHATCFS